MEKPARCSSVSVFQAENYCCSMEFFRDFCGPTIFQLEHWNTGTLEHWNTGTFRDFSSTGRSTLLGTITTPNAIAAGTTTKSQNMSQNMTDRLDFFVQ